MHPSRPPFGAVTALTDSESSHGDREQQVVLRRRKLRQRRPGRLSIRDRLVDQAVCRNLVSKVCIGKCKKLCLRKFAGKAKFQEFLAFRVQWQGMHKLDQDRLVS